MQNDRMFHLEDCPGQYFMAPARRQAQSRPLWMDSSRRLCRVSYLQNISDCYILLWYYIAFPVLCGLVCGDAFPCHIGILTKWKPWGKDVSAIVCAGQACVLVCREQPIFKPNAGWFLVNACIYYEKRSSLDGQLSITVMEVFSNVTCGTRSFLSLTTETRAPLWALESSIPVICYVPTATILF